MPKGSKQPKALNKVAILVRSREYAREYTKFAPVYTAKQRLPRNSVVFPRGPIWLMAQGKKRGAAVYDWFLDARLWKRAIRDRYLNHDMKVLPLKDIKIRSGRSIFIKPLLDHKAINGQLVDRFGLAEMQRIAETRVDPGSMDYWRTRMSAWDLAAYPYPETLMIIAKAKYLGSIHERWWWIGGKMIYDRDDEDHTDHPEYKEEARKLFRRLYKAGRMPMMCADFIKWKGKVRMEELNGVNFAGSTDWRRVMPAIIKYLSKHGRTVAELKANLHPHPF